jgi:hypothetical protein
MAIGAALYVLSYFSMGRCSWYAVSQVALRRRYHPHVLGFAFGPLGFFWAVTACSAMPDRLWLYPQWSVGNGLVGVAGLCSVQRSQKEPGRC